MVEKRSLEDVLADLKNAEKEYKEKCLKYGIIEKQKRKKEDQNDIDDNQNEENDEKINVEENQTENIDNIGKTISKS